MPIEPAELACVTRLFQLHACGARHFFDEFEKFIDEYADLELDPEDVDPRVLVLARGLLVNHREKWETYRDQLLTLSERMGEVEPEAIAAITAPQIASYEPAIISIDTAAYIAPHAEPQPNTSINPLIGAAILAAGVILGALIRG